MQNSIASINEILIKFISWIVLFIWDCPNYIKPNSILTVAIFIIVGISEAHYLEFNLNVFQTNTQFINNVTTLIINDAQSEIVASDPLLILLHVTRNVVNKFPNIISINCIRKIQLINALLALTLYSNATSCCFKYLTNTTY
jgi:hypothetical protein